MSDNGWWRSRSAVETAGYGSSLRRVFRSYSRSRALCGLVSSHIIQGLEQSLVMRLSFKYFLLPLERDVTTKYSQVYVTWKLKPYQINHPFKKPNVSINWDWLSIVSQHELHIGTVTQQVRRLKTNNYLPFPYVTTNPLTMSIVQTKEHRLRYKRINKTQETKTEGATKYDYLSKWLMDYGA